MIFKLEYNNRMCVSTFAKNITSWKVYLFPMFPIAPLPCIPFTSQCSAVVQTNHTDTLLYYCELKYLLTLFSTSAYSSSKETVLIETKKVCSCVTAFSSAIPGNVGKYELCMECIYNIYSRRKDGKTNECGFVWGYHIRPLVALRSLFLAKCFSDTCFPLYRWNIIWPNTTVIFRYYFFLL